MISATIESRQADLYSALDLVLGRHLALSGDEVYQVLIDLADQYASDEDNRDGDEDNEEDD